MSSKNFYGLTGDVTIDGGILNVANTNVSGNVTSTSLLVSNVATLGTTKTFVVRASGGAYYIDEDERKSLELHEGQTYIFDISHSSLANSGLPNGEHPLEFSTGGTDGNGSPYTTGISSTGTAGTTGAKKTFVVPAGTTSPIYYYCTRHSGMGGQINISPAAELVVSGRIVASGNVEASKITASANVEVTGNVVASRFVGDGSLLTNVTGATTSGLQTVTDNSPTTTNTIQFTNPTTSLRASSNIVATGNVTADHFIGDGSQLSGIVTSVSLEAAVNTANTTSNTVQFTNTSTSLTASGNVEVAGNVVVSGNVEAAYFVGDGSKLTGIVTSVNLSDAVNTGNTTSNTVQFTNTSTSLTASGNVEVAGNVVATYFVGDGSRLTGLPSGGNGGGSGTSHWTKDAVTNQLHYSTGNVGISNTNPAHDLSVGSNLHVNDVATDGVLMVTGNVHATHFVGDGSRLSGLPGGAQSSWSAPSGGNMLFYPPNPAATSKFIGVMNNTPQHTLSVGSNLFVDDTGSNVLVVDGDITAESMFLGALGIKPSYPLDTVTDAGNVTPHTISFTNPTLGITTASNVEIGGALTVGKGTLGGSNLEVGEANLFVNTQLTRVGIGTDLPEATLHVNGSLEVDGPLTFGIVNVVAQHGLEAITAVDNTTPLTIELQNADTSLVTTGNVEVGGNVITSKDLTVTGNVTTNSELIVAGNVFYTNLMSVSVKSNVVTEYTGPHDRPLRKYPEVVLTADDNLSTSGYKASVSSQHLSDAYRVFDATGSTTYWHSQYPYYTHVTGTYNPGQSASGTGTPANGTTLPTTELISGHQGEWIKLQMPTRIKLEEVRVYASNRAASSIYQMPKDIAIAGSNDGTNWYLVDSGTLRTGIRESYGMASLLVTTSSYYSYLALIVKTIDNQGQNFSAVEIANIEYYGHEEGSGSLDTTLKTVYNVPATTGTQLEVYYDAKDLDNGAVTSVTDLSSKSNNGSPTDVSVSDGAFVFNGTSSLLEKTSLSIPGGDNPLTFSFWVKSDDFANNQYIFRLGINQNMYQTIALYKNSSGQFIFASWTLDFPINYTFTPNQWNHVSLVYPGGGWKQTNLIAYVDGKPYTFGGNESSGGLGGSVMSLATSLTLRLGGFSSGGDQFDGSIANFRLYSKALNAGQVQELYDYQKDYFLGSKSQLTLYKGHLGVGVTEPSGQLELAGDERLQEYPPGPMSDYDTYIPGHGVFTAIASSNYTYINGAYNAFDKQHPVGTNGWASMFAGGTTYDTYDGESHGIRTDGALPTGRDKLEGISGSWIGLKMPYDVKVTKIYWYPRFNNDGLNRRRETIQDGIIWGSKDGTNWVQLRALSGVTYQEYALGGTYSNDDPFVFDINNNNYYDRYVIQLTKLGENTSGAASTFATCQEIKFFGTPGPTTLDKGSLSLGRSLDVPRVSRYDVDTETPRPEKLLIDYDTTVNSSLTDISGKGNHGRFFDDAHWSESEKAFEFDGTDDYTQTDITIAGGNMAWTQSMWFKINAFPASSSTYAVLSFFGNKSQTDGFIFSYKNDFMWQDWYGNGVYFPYTFEVGKWYHVVSVYHGNTSTDANVRSSMYVNGVKQPLTWYSQTSAQQNLPTSTFYELGDYINSANVRHNGWISNPKFYTVALEPSEVRKLYNLGRIGRSMVITDTAVGIGKAPEAQLDVRGVIDFDATKGDIVLGGEVIKRNVDNKIINLYSGSDAESTYIFMTAKNRSSNNNKYGLRMWTNTVYEVRKANTTSTPVHAFTGNLTVTGSYPGSSDDRIKFNESAISNPLNLIAQLNPQKYERISDFIDKTGTWIPTDTEWESVKDNFVYIDEFGLIAQDVRNIPELAFLVNGEETRTDTNILTHDEYSNLTTEEQDMYTTSYIYDSNVITQEQYSNLTSEEQEVTVTQYKKQIETQTPLSLNYQGLFVVAIGAIKELKAKNEALETQVSDLLERVTALENA